MSCTQQPLQMNACCFCRTYDRTCTPQISEARTYLTRSWRTMRVSSFALTYGISRFDHAYICLPAHTCLIRDTCVASAFLKALGGLSHLLLAHPVGLHALALTNGSWNPLRVGQSQDEPQRSVGIRPLDWQRLIGYISQRNQAHLAHVLPRVRCMAESVFVCANNTSEVCDDDLELWSVVEAARLCVRGRLRTSFGGATLTFEALEHMLLEACAREDIELRCDLYINIRVYAAGRHTLSHTYAHTPNKVTC